MSKAMMPMTTSNSTRVKALRLHMVFLRVP